MKITSLSKQKNKKIYNLFADGEFLCSVDDELIVLHQLHTGKEINGDYIKEIKQEASLRKAFNMSVNYLSFKMRTQQEIQDYLLGKEFQEGIVNSVIEKLKKYKYIDDDNYIVLYVKSKISQGYSKRKILYNLIKKGLKEENVLTQLDINYPKDIELSYLEVQIAKQNEKYKQLPYRDRVSKINQSFLRKGYNHEDIGTVINQIISQENEPSHEFIDRLEKLGNNYMKKYLNKDCDPKEAKLKTTQALYRKGYDMDVIKKYFET
ncbi:RecX family transcriptional regulator [Alkalibaculum sporogenes]|nr:RecX family transcriptional regulator [Alkalibaculum sporogenes]